MTGSSLHGSFAQLMSVPTENKVVKSADHETTMGYVLKNMEKVWWNILATLWKIMKTMGVKHMLGLILGKSCRTVAYDAKHMKEQRINT